jgi:hypothetical protein
MVLEGLEEGICFHDHCLTACGKDAITHAGAYGVSYKTMDNLSILQAIKQYHRAATGGNELRVQQWADAQLKSHSDKETKYAKDLAAWNAYQIQQARAAEVSMALRMAEQDINAINGIGQDEIAEGAEEDQGDASTNDAEKPALPAPREIPAPPSSLLALIPIMNEVDENNTHLHSQADWYKQQVTHLNRFLHQCLA